MGVTGLVFELKPVKAKIKGVFNTLYHCYGNLKCQENNHILFTIDWASVRYHIVVTSTERES